MGFRVWGSEFVVGDLGLGVSEFLVFRVGHRFNIASTSDCSAFIFAWLRGCWVDAPFLFCIDFGLQHL